MEHSSFTLKSPWVFMAIMVVVGTLAFAQGATTTSLSGLVVDSSGGIIPGADVVVKHNGTGAVFTSVTSERGTFSIPALNPGTYTVTVSLQGFKTVVLNDVILETAVPATVRATLEVGGLAETVVVLSGSEIVQTQTSAVATTLNVTSVSNLPIASRNVLDIVPFLPGVNTPGGNRDSTVNGLPQSMINITLDGINIQDNTLKTTDGFFTIVQPRLDAIEEVTFSTAAQGADSAGQGAVQIRFVTRSGTNELRGSAYYYARRSRWNENTWFGERDKLPIAALEQNQPGGRLGGPIVIPGLFDGHNKAFFFVNYEEFRQPTDVTRNRTILHPLAQQGIFRYNTSAGVQQVDLLALAARSGHASTVDPTVAKLLADIRGATGTTGAILDQPDPNLQQYRYLVPQRAHNRFPTVSVDFNLTEKHRLKGTLNWHTFLSTPDTLNSREPNFPGFPVTGNQTSERVGVSSSLRSTLSSNLVNELRVGGSGAPVRFSNELTKGMWGGTSVADQAGFQLNISTAAANITNASSGPTPSSRNASTWVVEDTVNWIKGAHSLGMGGSFQEVNLWLKNQTLAPTINFGVDATDPANAIFTTANFPGASGTNLNDARDLYAVLVGRVTAINGNIGLNEDTDEYEYLGLRVQRARMRELSFFAQDTWRVRPTLTLNLGLRYALQLPFTALNNSYSTATIADAWGISGLTPNCDPSAATPATCNVFKPGTLAGARPQFVQFDKGTRAFNTDSNNWAPSVGVNWTPSPQDGWLRWLFGDSGDTAIRGGWARAFTRNGMSDFTGRIDDNPGIVVNANRDITLGNLGTLPVLFRDRQLLGPPVFPNTRVYPITDYQVTQSLGIFDPDLQVPYADSWTIGIQRAISQTMTVEARYVGTRSRELWRTYNYNEINIVENGFLNEFRLAQQNLRANIAAGRGSTFRYFGPATGTSPLPIILAHFSGVPASQAGDAARYTSTLFTSSTFLTPLAIYNPNPCCGTGTANPSFAFSLYNNATRRANALAAGLPANFFIANPDLQGGVNVTGNGDYTNYHSLQVELRRRMSQGLQFQGSYVYGQAYGSDFYSFRKPRLQTLDTGGEGGVVHAFKAVWDYQLPFGRGRRFASGVGPVLDRLVGGWQIHGTARIQSGRLLDFGNVRMVGFTKDDLRDMFKLRIDQGQRVWMLPQEVIDNTVRAFSVSATSATGYGALGPPTGRYFAPANGPDCIEEAPGFGDCGVRTLVVRGPMFKNIDLSVMKAIPIKGRTNVEIRFEMLNVLNWFNFTPVTGEANSTYSNPNSFEVTGPTAADSARIVQIVSRITW